MGDLPAKFCARGLAAILRGEERGGVEAVIFDWGGTSARVEEILLEAGVGDARHPAAFAAYTAYWEPHTHTDPRVRPAAQLVHTDARPDAVAHELLDVARTVTAWRR